MKRILLLSLLLLPIVALAQYPTFSNKQKLGVQTTGDGLIFRGTTINNIPTYVPSNVNNAYFHLDTVHNKLYLYNANAWQLVYPSPQFDTTTLNVYLKISDTTAMLLPYFRDSDTTSLNLINRFALKLNISDTATMLTSYMKKVDTISLSNRINLKLNISDTIILSNRITTNANNIITINNKLATKLDTIYVKFKNVVTMIENKDTINIGSSLTDGYAINIIGDSVNIDTVILDARYPDRDSTNELQDITFATTSGIVTISGGKVMNLDTLYNSVIDSVNLLIRDSIAAFTPLTEGYGINIIGDSINVDTDIIFTQSDTITLSNRINTKLDTIYVNYQTSIDTIVNKDTINITTLEAGAGINITNNVISLDTVLLDSVVRVQNVYVKNGTGTVLNKGEAVYVTGANGTNIIVGRASNVAESSSSKTLGLTMTSIPIDGFGYVIKEGLLSGLNTSAADSAGVPIWLSNTPGGLIFGLTNKPYAPNHLVYLGVVTRKQQNNGEVYVTVQNGFEIKELHDVQIIDPVNKASLYYNSSQNLWRDTTAALLVSDTASMLNPYLRKLDTISLSNRIDKKFNSVDTSILGYVTTYSNQLNINGNKTFNNTVSVDSLNATKQAKIQSLTVGKGGYTITGGTPGAISSTAFGFEALKNNTSGDWNTAIGYQALLNNDTAWNNVAIGNNSLNTNISGEYNTAIGVESLFSNKVGNNNVAIGYYAGTTNKGNNNIYIGNQTYHTDSVNNVLMIGGINTPLLSGIITGNKKLGVNVNPLNLTNTFEVNSPISNAVKINSNTNSTNLELMNSGGSVFIKSGNKNMTLQTDTTALVYLKGDVNKVGILTMNPEQALEVAGTIRVDSLVNNLTPDKLVGANNSNDLTDIKIGNGLSFLNDTLKVDDNIINSGDTATLLRQDFIPLTSNQVIWTQGNKKLLKYFTQVYRNGQLLKDVQYTISSDSIITIEEGSYKLGDIITVIAIDNIVALAGSGSMITLQGDITGNGTNSITTYIGVGKVTNSMLAGSISDTKLNTITTAGKISNSATTATNSNTGNTIVSRDDSGNFSAGIITASLNGNANTATNVAYSGLTGTVPIWNQNTTGNAATVTTNANLTGDVTSIGNATSIATGVIVNADINASAAIAVSKLAASTISGVTLGNYLNTLTISSPLTGTSYNGSSAVTIGIPAATGSVNGYLTSTDWTTFNNKQNQLNGTGFVKASGTSITYDNSSYLRTGLADSTYLKLTGGTLSGALYIKAGNGNQLNLNNSGERFTQLNFSNNDIFKSAIWYDNTNSKLVFNSNPNSIFNYNLEVLGATTLGSTLAVTGDITENGNNVLTSADTTSMLLPYFRDTDTTLLNLTSRFNTKQNILSGTGFVKANNTTISYDNSTYLTTSTAASTYLPLTGGTLTGGFAVNAATVLNGTGGNNDTRIESDNNTNMFFVDASTDRVGIGTNAPTNTLDVNGSLALNGTLWNFNNVNNRNGYLYFDHSGVQVWKFGLFNDNTSTLSLGNGGNFNRIFNIANNGYIGINDTTPSFALDINGSFSSNGLFRFGGNTNYIEHNFDNGGFYSEIYGTTSNNRHIRFQGLNDAQTKYTSINLYAGLSTIMFKTDEFNKMELTNNLLVINEDSQDTDFRVESDGNANMVFVDASANRVGIGTNAPTNTLDVNGTLGVTGATTLSNLGSVGTGVVVTSNTGLLSTATTINQTGLITTGSTTVSTGGSTAFFDVTHNLGVNPQSVIITSQTISGGSTKIFCEVIGKDASVFRVQAFNLDGSLATNKVVNIYWIAIK